MACNRDELHGREPAIPPAGDQQDGVAYLMPIDPSSQGTWVAANDAGLAMTLLNYNTEQPPLDRTLSRGGVIPSLISSDTLSKAIDRCGGIEREAMMPFRLVLCDGEHVAVWRSDQPSDEMTVSRLAQPVFFTSSGLGDHLVEAPRREVFQGWFQGQTKQWIDRQDELHRHRFPGRSHLSICMDREDARTVSYTTVEVSSGSVVMGYHAGRPDEPGPMTTRRLDRRVML